MKVGLVLSHHKYFVVQNQAVSIHSQSVGFLCGFSFGGKGRLDVVS